DQHAVALAVCKLGRGYRLVPVLVHCPERDGRDRLGGGQRVVPVWLALGAPRDEVEVHVRGLVRLVAEARLRALDAQPDGGACFKRNQERYEGCDNEKLSHASRLSAIRKESFSPV